MIRFRFKHGKLQYQWFVWRGWCRIGLHFMQWDFPRDQYMCPCGYNILRAEEIR